MGGIEAGVDIVTGGVAGRAVEPGAGEHHMPPNHGPEHGPERGAAHATTCLNCGTHLIGAHCHACGQSAHVHRTAGAILHDIAHGVFHFEGKARHTLPMLVMRPGELTRRYIDGERARFVSPLAVFLFSVFLMFAIVANLPGWSFNDAKFGDDDATGLVTQGKLTEERIQNDGRIAALTRDLRTARAERQPNADRIIQLEKRMADATRSRAIIADVSRLLPADEGAAPPAGADTSDTWFEAKFRHAKENPKLLLYKLKTSSYKFSWALIPISIPFLWLLFPFSRRVGLYDHAVFTTYSLTFMSLLTITLALLGAVGVASNWLIAAAILIPPFHMYRQMKGTYGLGRKSALIRTALLTLLIASAIIPIFALLMLSMGLS